MEKGLLLGDCEMMAIALMVWDSFCGLWLMRMVIDVLVEKDVINPKFV